LESLLAPLGLTAETVHAWTTSRGAQDWIVRNDVLCFALPAPARMEKSPSNEIRILCLAETLITYRGCQPESESDQLIVLDYDTPLIARSVPALLLRVMEHSVDHDLQYSFDLRNCVDSLSDRLPKENTAFDIEAVERSFKNVGRLISNCFDYQHVFIVLQFLNVGVFHLRDEHQYYHLAEAALDQSRSGLLHLQGRLERLHTQYRLDIQTQTGSRLRILTILSAVCLPLTLVAGIYGMNFQFMPELDERYAYFAVLAFMVVLAGFMLIFFYSKGWFK
jgi:magnesium transporter